MSFFAANLRLHYRSEDNDVSKHRNIQGCLLSFCTGLLLSPGLLRADLLPPFEFADAQTAPNGPPGGQCGPVQSFNDVLPFVNLSASCSSVADLGGHAFAEGLTNANGLLNATMELDLSTAFYNGFPSGEVSVGFRDNISVAPNAPHLVDGSNGYLEVVTNTTGDFSFTCGMATTLRGGGCILNYYSLGSVVTVDGGAQSISTVSGTDLLLQVNQNEAIASTTIFAPPDSEVALIPIVFGEQHTLQWVLDIQAGLGSVEAFGPGFGSVNSILTADFSDPPVIQVLDSNMQPIDATVTSALGVDYSGAVPATVPEPASIWLAITGVVYTALRTIVHGAGLQRRE